MRTIGISPKVIAAVTASSGIGLILLVVSLATDDADLRTVALTLLAGGAVSGGAAAQASPGTVVVTEQEDATAGLGEPPAGTDA